MNQERFAEMRILRWHDPIKAQLAGENRGPIRANLDLTNLCNHKCYFCEPAEYRAETVRNKKHTLDTQHAMEVIHDLHAMGCWTLGFSGGGEPLLHPDFGHLLSYAKYLDFKVWINTNGSYISKWAKELERADSVRISLDAATTEQHKAMHGARDFEAIIANIESLAGKTELGISYIFDGTNQAPEDIEWVKSFAARVGAFVQFKPLSDKDHAPPLLEEAGSDKRLKDVFFQREFDKCYAAMTMCVVGANGDVQACCDRRDLVYGNVYENRLTDIWNSPRHKQVARDIVPQFCQRCVLCGFNRGVKQLIVEDQARTWIV